jgi:hypothetical protein
MGTERLPAPIERDPGRGDKRQRHEYDERSRIPRDGTIENRRINIARRLHRLQSMRHQQLCDATPRLRMKMCVERRREDPPAGQRLGREEDGVGDQE